MVKENELRPFVFENGEQVLVRRISPFTVMDARDAIDKPIPPMQKVSYGDSETLEANYGHPDYLAAMKAYNEKVNKVARDLMIKRGVVIHLDDEQKAQVQELREFWLEEYKKTLNGSDDFLYVAHFCFSSENDMNRLVEAISGMSQPTKAEVDKAAESFPGDIPGS